MRYPKKYRFDIINSNGLQRSVLHTMDSQLVAEVMLLLAP